MPALPPGPAGTGRLAAQRRLTATGSRSGQGPVSRRRLAGPDSLWEPPPSPWLAGHPGRREAMPTASAGSARPCQLSGRVRRSSNRSTQTGPQRSGRLEGVGWTATVPDGWAWCETFRRRPASGGATFGERLPPTWRAQRSAPRPSIQYIRHGSRQKRRLRSGEARQLWPGGQKRRLMTSWTPCTGALGGGSPKGAGIHRRGRSRQAPWALASMATGPSARHQVQLLITWVHFRLWGTETLVCSWTGSRAGTESAPAPLPPRSLF